MTDLIPSAIEKMTNLLFHNGLNHQKEIRSLPIKQIKQIQWKRLKNILEFVYQNNDFYYQLFSSVKLTPDDIKKPEDMLNIPITTKKKLKKNFSSIITRNVDIRKHTISCTSGATGEPFKFYVDNNREKKSLYFAYLLDKKAMGIKPFKKINVLEIKTNPTNQIDINSKKINKTSSNLLKDIFISNIIGLKAIDVTKLNIENILEIIEKYNIKAIYGYTSSIFILAKYFSELKKEYSFDYIILIGESLLKQQREFIQKNLNAPVYLDYGASECQRMGFECKYQNGYHMDIYNYYFEYLKEDRYARDYETGDIIVTNLNNYVFPFIRYKIGDQAKLTDTKCDCPINFPIVENIYGRANTIIKTPSGLEISSGSFNVFFEYLHQYINQYQIIQPNRKKLYVKIVTTEKVTNKTKDNIIKKIYSQIEEITEKSMNIKIKIVNKIDPFSSGKTLEIVNFEQYKKLIKKGESIRVD